MTKKEKIIQQIGQRIKDEHRKHPTLEWWDIAARKIYSSHISTPPVEALNHHALSDELTCGFCHKDYKLNDLYIICRNCKKQLTPPTG